MLLSGRGSSSREVCLVVLAAISLGLWVAPAAEAADFCETTIVYDYAKPLKGLPASPSPPLDEHLSFAPARVFLGRHAYGPLQLGQGERGFSLSFSPYSESNSASRRVGWQVTSRLTKVDRHGRRLAASQTIERHVKRVPAGRGLDFGFDVPGKPAIYKLEIVFEDGAGKRLARFGEYFRVLRPSLDVNFFLNGATFHRGETVQAWLANRGVAFLSFGLEKTIEYNDGTTWTPVQFSSGVVPAIGLGIGPGERTSCWGVTIPQNAALGTYRFAKTIDHSTDRLFFRSAPLEVSAEFTVAE